MIKILGKDARFIVKCPYIRIDGILPVLYSFIQLYSHQKSVNFQKLYFWKIKILYPLYLSLSLYVFYVTCNDISVIHVTAQMCRWIEEEVVPTVGLPTHRHFVGFLNVPVLHRHGTTLFIRWFRNTAPCSRLLRHAGDTLNTNCHNHKIYIIHV